MALNYRVRTCIFIAKDFGAKWAYAVPTDKFPNLADLWVTLENFMKYCNITMPPNIRRGLFP